MNIHISIDAGNIYDLKAAIKALAPIAGMVETDQEVEAKPTENQAEQKPDKQEEPKEEAPKSKSKAKPKNDQGVETPKEEMKPVENTPPASSVEPAPTNTETKATETPVDVAALRTLATDAIRKGKSAEVNTIVTATGAPSLSKIPADKLPEVYEALRKLVG